MAAALEVVELLDHDPRIDDAAGPDRRRLAGDDAGRDLADLVGLAVDDDRVPGVRPTLVAADEVGVLGEQVDDLALALVAPLRTDDHGGRHGDSLHASDSRRRRARPSRRRLARTSMLPQWPTTGECGSSSPTRARERSSRELLAGRASARTATDRAQALQGEHVSVSGDDANLFVYADSPAAGRARARGHPRRARAPRDRRDDERRRALAGGRGALGQRAGRRDVGGGGRGEGLRALGGAADLPRRATPRSRSRSSSRRRATARSATGST